MHTFKIYRLFGCTGSLLLRRLFSGCGEWGLHSSCSQLAAHCSSVSSCGAWPAGHAGFRACGSCTLEHRPGSCGAQAWLLYCMRDLPGPGIELMSPAWADGFFTAEPSQGSSKAYIFKMKSELGLPTYIPLWSWVVRCLVLPTRGRRDSVSGMGFLYSVSEGITLTELWVIHPCIPGLNAQ